MPMIMSGDAFGCLISAISLPPAFSSFIVENVASAPNEHKPHLVWSETWPC